MKLQLHIGAGKTGTTSIQNVLLNNELNLKNGKVKYLGLMLENAYQIKYEWQKKTTVNTDFYSLPEDQAKKQALDVLSHTIEQAEKDGIKSLIWSNESFFDHSKHVLPIISELIAKKIEVQIIVYLRPHETWLESAYIQWGLKHKTYKGKLKSFSEWTRDNSPSFASRISEYWEHYSNLIILRNMDAISNGDVVSDFLKILDLEDLNLGTQKSNKAPENEELLLRTMFNSTYPSQVLPVRFNNMFEFFSPSFDSPEEYLQKFLPSNEAMAEIQNLIEEDREKLNSFLRAKSEPAFSKSKYQEKQITIDRDVLIMLVAQLTIGQSRRIDKLERRILQLEEFMKNG